MLMYVGFFIAMECLRCKKQTNNMLMYGERHVQPV